MGIPNPFKGGRGGNPFAGVEDGIKRGINSLGDQVKDGVRHVGDEVKDEARKQIRNAADDIKREVLDQIKNEAQKAAGTVKREVVDEVGREAQKAVSTVTIEIQNVSEHALAEVQKAASEVEQLAEDAIKAAVEELAKAITAEGLRKFRAAVKATHDQLDKIRRNRPALADAIDELSIYLELGPATLTWGAFYARADIVLASIDQHIAKPPSFKRSEVMRLIKALGPTKVNLGVSVHFALVIGSKEFGVGGGVGDIPIDLFTELGDVILDELGVPE